MDEIKLRAIAHTPTTILNLSILPVTIQEIIEIGYEQYNQYLSVLNLKTEQLVSEFSIPNLPEHIQFYDIILKLYHGEQISAVFLDCLKFFLKTKEIVYKDALYINNLQVTAEVFNYIVKIIFIQNGVENDSLSFNPKNQRAKKIREKMLENQRKIQELKKNSGSENEALSFIDLISILCSNANGITFFNVFKLNMFQFNDQFNRMKLLNDYQISVQSLLHGADPKKVEIKHWISKSS